MDVNKALKVELNSLKQSYRKTVNAQERIIKELEEKQEKDKCEMDLAVNILKFHNASAQSEVQLLKKTTGSLNLTLLEKDKIIQQLTDQNSKLQEEVQNYKELASPDSDEDDLFYVDSVELNRQLQVQRDHHLRIITKLKEDNQLLTAQISKLKDKFSTHSEPIEVINNVDSLNQVCAFGGIDDLIQRQNLKRDINMQNSVKNNHHSKQSRRGKKKY